MVFIDYVTVMLINMVAAFLVLAAFLLTGKSGSPWGWATPLGLSGLVAFVTGLHMIFRWPLIGPYNSAFGESSVLLGAILLGIALNVGMNWQLGPLSIYIVVGSIVPIILGARIIHLGMTQQPTLSGLGFILSGLGGVLVGLAFAWQEIKPLRYVAATALVLAALIWALTGYMAFWMHMNTFEKWVPPDAKKLSQEP